MCKTTIRTQNNVHISTIAWTETRLSTTLLLKVLILLPGAAEHSVSLCSFFFFSFFFFTAVETCGLNKQTNCYKGSLLLKSGRTKCPLLKTRTLSFSLNPKQMMRVLERRKGQERGGRGMRVDCFTVSLWIANNIVWALLCHILTLLLGPVIFAVSCPEVAGHGSNKK